MFSAELVVCKGSPTQSKCVHTELCFLFWAFCWSWTGPLALPMLRSSSVAQHSAVALRALILLRGQANLGQMLVDAHFGIRLSACLAAPVWFAVDMARILQSVNLQALVQPC